MASSFDRHNVFSEISRRCESSVDIFPIIEEFMRNGNSTNFKKLITKYVGDHEKTDSYSYERERMIDEFYRDNPDRYNGAGNLGTLYNFLRWSYENNIKNVLRYGVICIQFIRKYLPPSTNFDYVPIEDMETCIEMLDDCLTSANMNDYDTCITILTNILNILGNTKGAGYVEDVLRVFELDARDAPDLVEPLAPFFGVDFQR